jgi:formate dehydrogenase major subunit
MPPKPTPGFKWVVEAMEKRKAKLISVDPRFNRTSAVADFYAPIRNGTDIAFLGGVINYLLSHDKIHHEYVKFNTDATFLTKPGYGIENGLFSGYDEAKRKYDKSSWGYQLDENGYVKVDDSCRTRVRLQQLKKHYSRYTPEMVSKICGTPQDKFLKVCEMLARCPRPTRP